ncbi:MAG: hypothetical protein EOO15_00770 [Chitinophagaceae bacterium]|nr:MAG: hypothetical protein EOO15_00770 [Chitinophagaceae bacterium]
MMNELVARLLTRPFYRAHVILMLFLVLLAFAAVQRHMIPSYHAALMRMFLQHPLLFVALLLSWSGYFARIAQRGRRLFHSSEGNFLSELRHWTLRRQALLLLRPAIEMGAPFLLYAGVFAGYAMLQQAWWAASVLLLFIVAALALVVRHWLRLLNVLPPMKQQRARMPQKPVPFMKWPLLHLLRTQARTLLLVKAVSLLLLYIPLVWNADRFDHDSLPLFLIGMIAANAFLAPQLVRFLEERARFHRNVPMRGSQIALLLYGSYLLLLVPEALYIFYAGYNLLPIHLLTGIALAAPHTLFLLASIGYGSSKGESDAWKALGGISFVSLFFFNKEAYLWWDALQLMMGALLFAAHYRRYE